MGIAPLQREMIKCSVCIIVHLKRKHMETKVQKLDMYAV